MKRRAGFTLIEAAIVMAVVGLLAAATGATLLHARKNASAGSTAYEVLLRFQGLKTRALQEQRDYAAVFINPNGDAASGCHLGSPATCARMVVLAGPPSSWTLDGFDTGAPGLVIDEIVSLERDIVLDRAAIGLAAAAPFGTITQLPTSMQATCKAPTPADSSATGMCYAVRFGADGTVGPIYPGAAPGTAPAGIALGFTSDAKREALRSWRVAVLVTFPTGILKTFPY